MTVRASTLVSVQWPPEPTVPAIEVPDTLVLSVDTYYVDLRVNQQDGSIYWALAGRRIVVSEEPRKVKFTHTIDSHSDDQHNDTTAENQDEVADEGEFTKLPNGDDLEIGEMPAPHLGGKVASYREIWRELKSSFESDGMTSVTSMPLNWYLESLGDGDDDDGKAGSGKRSFYVRAGKFFLAIRRTEAKMSDADKNNVKYGFSAIRQEIVDTEKSKWTTQYSMGDQVEDMLKLSDSSTFESGFIVENENRDNNLSWQVDDRLVIRNSHDGAIREMCIVRAVS